jgi:hypothetical protein
MNPSPSGHVGGRFGIVGLGGPPVRGGADRRAVHSAAAVLLHAVAEASPDDPTV